LLPRGTWQALRQRLREWLYDGADKADPWHPQGEGTACFAPWLRWGLAWWQGETRARALDATAHGALGGALGIRVRYRRHALPVAWAVLPAHQPGAWMPGILTLVQALQPAGPPSLTVRRLADRGLWSPRLGHPLPPVGWQPVVRLQNTTSFQPPGQGRRPVRTLVTGPGQAWGGRGIACKTGTNRQAGTGLVGWDAAPPTPWGLLTALVPAPSGVCWSGVRGWSELGFRALQGLGWQWQHPRRSEPTRGARHWLVWAVALLWGRAYGTRAEDAAQQGGGPPARLVRPSAPPTGRRRRWVRVVRRGLQALRQTLGRGDGWRRLWLVPAPWPEPPPHLRITYHTGP